MWGSLMVGLLARSQNSGQHVDGESQHPKVEEEGEHSVHCNCPADAVGRNVQIRGLAGHPDHEGEVHEIGENRLANGSTETFDSLHREKTHHGKTFKCFDKLIHHEKFQWFEASDSNH